jgi:hypothetical protein
VDLPSDSLADDINWLYKFGVAGGITAQDGKKFYMPGTSVYRSQMATFMYKLAGSPAFSSPIITPFVDVPTTHPQYKEIAWLASEGISTGATDTATGKKIYAPNGTVRRDQMAIFMYTLAGSPSYTPPSKSVFSDVDSYNNNYDYIAWLSSWNISNGVTIDGKKLYMSASSVTRGQMSTFMHKLYDGVLSR